MKSIRDLYKIGKGPSSSHTMGPARAAEIFKSENPDAERYEVVLYGSLAKTGIGHGTDRVLRDVFAPKDVQIVFAEHDPDDLKHPNTLDLSAFTGAEKTASIRVESIGGGDIVVEGRPGLEPPEVYPENSFAEIAQFCAWRQVSLPQYVEMNEGPEIWDFLKDIWNAMRKEIHDGLSAEGVLPGGLNVQRKAKYLFERGHQVDIPQVRELQQVCAYAFAAAEQNAGNGTIVTAPTCGSCGVLPAVLLYLQDKYKFTDEKIAEALSVAGLLGCLIKRNASVSGAECGCQAEIGASSAMAAGALAWLKSGSSHLIIQAAAMALKSLLGLVCDPVAGLVEVPCVKRNASGAMNALCAVDMALAGIESAIPVDEVIDAMREIGDLMHKDLRETGKGGLAATATGMALAEQL